MAAAWRFGFTDCDPGHHLLGVGLRALAFVVGVFLFKPAKFAIVLSAIAAVIAICAAIRAPIVQGAGDSRIRAGGDRVWTVRGARGAGVDFLTRALTEARQRSGDPAVTGPDTSVPQPESTTQSMGFLR